jgi:hypothetical protein
MKPSAPVTKAAIILSWVIAAILIVIPFHALLTTWLGSNVDHLDLIRIWKDVLAVLMLPVALFLVLARPAIRRRLFASWTFRLFLLYTVLSFILGIWAYADKNVTASALIYGLIINLRFIYFFIICLVAAATSDILVKNWPKIMLGPAFAVVAFGLLQKFLLPYDFLKHFGYSPQVIPAYQAVDANLDYTRVQSTLRGANPLGAYLVIIVPAIIFSIKRHIYRWSFAVLAVVVLFFTYSRSAYLGVVIALASFIWIRAKRLGARWVVIGLFFLVAASSLYVGLRSNQTVQDVLLHTSNSSKSAVSSNEIRNAALKQGLSDIKTDPAGKGPGTAGPASFRNFGHTARIAENYYLQIGQETGVLGMLLFIGINILVALQLWARRQDLLAQILLASLIGISFINLVSHAWTDDTLAYVWWGLAGICLGPAILQIDSKQKNAKKIKPA